MSGSISAIGAIVLFVTSISILRRKLFNFFLIFHLIGTLVFIVAGVIHAGGVGWAAAAALLCNGVDWYFRVKSLYHSPVLKSVKLLPGQCCRIAFERPDDFEYIAGQYGFLMIPKLSSWEWHPFSFSSSPEDPDEIVMCIRVLGNWSKNLVALAERAEQSKETFSVFMDGPYGRPSLKLENYDSVLLISGGIGITPMQSMFNSMLLQHTKGINPKKRVMFVWSVRDKIMLEALTQDLHSPASILAGTDEESDPQQSVLEKAQRITQLNNKQLSQRILDNAGKDMDPQNKQAILDSMCDDAFPVAFQPMNLLVQTNRFSQEELQGIEEGETSSSSTTATVIQPSSESESATSTQPSSTSSLPFETLFYLTRATADTLQADGLDKNPCVKFGRPPLEALLNEMNNTTDSQTDTVAVMTCGPAQLVADVYSKCQKWNAKAGDGDVKFHIHSELFTF
eukprot:TRINITY_DN2321_c0_g1_i1.p1 TRINITY_DN2321_c0_g1~~TRINITY_DN2321_c0_g1_i1.p1  ORF type:complete len:453 (+),score=147.23 TRINITY_DN2321_c0_g1_i1:476-1834(+)